MKTSQRDLTAYLERNNECKKCSALLTLLITTGLIHAQTIVPSTSIIVLGNAMVQGSTLVNDTLTLQPEINLINPFFDLRAEQWLFQDPPA